MFFPGLEIESSFRSGGPRMDKYDVFFLVLPGKWEEEPTADCEGGFISSGF